MSLREEQCNKVCRILDDVLANRPTERDLLIVAVRKAFKALAEPHWIPCTPETMPEDGERVLCTHLGGIDPNRQVIEHIYQGGKFTLGWEMDMNPSSPTFMQRYMGKVIAWTPLPEPYQPDLHCTEDYCEIEEEA